MNKKITIISDHYTILYFALLTFFFNIYLLYLPCIPIFPDKIILIVTLFVTLSLIILIPIKLVKYKNKNKKIPKSVKTILDASHWLYLLIIPIGILSAKSLSLIALMVCISWFALIGRVIYGTCPFSSVAETQLNINTTEGLVNLYFIICCIVGSVRLLIN